MHNWICQTVKTHVMFYTEEYITFQQSQEMPHDAKPHTLSTGLFVNLSYQGYDENYKFLRAGIGEVDPYGNLWMNC